MSIPMIGELRLFAFSFAPVGWLACNGQELPISQHMALFSLLGTTYGGNGQTTFRLPDLRGRVPRHTGSGVALGQTGGASNEFLSVNQMPNHGHGLPASEDLAGIVARLDLPPLRPIPDRTAR